MKHLQIRLENEEHAAFELRVRNIFGGSNLQKAARKIILAWTNPASARSDDLTSEIASRISVAVLKVDETKGILEGLHHALTVGTAVPKTPQDDDFPGSVKEVLGASPEHPRAPGDLGTGTGQPAGWRRGYSRKSTRPAGKD